MSGAGTLRIALVSYEFAGTLMSGGIGTYMRMLASMLAARGHDIEIFCHGAGYESRVGDAIVVNGVDVERGAFREAIVPVFSRRHAEKPFDLIEGADFLAETAGISASHSEVPVVLKLHTPTSFIAGSIDGRYIPLARKLRFMAGGLARGRLPRPYWLPDPANDVERTTVLAAAEITSPSIAMAKSLEDFWGLDVDRVSIVPNIFTPDPALLGVDPQTRNNRVLYVGRLEFRKGVLDLADAIPIVLRSFPEAEFTVVGRSLPHPVTGEDLKEMMERRLGKHRARVTFVGGVPHHEIASYYEQNDICVFPSIWENFPNVCLEAMAAARGVVASSAGGMAEMIVDGESGLLTPARRPRDLAKAILALLRHPERRQAMGRLARQKVLASYNAEIIGAMQEASYHRAISRCRPPVPACEARA